MCKVHCGLFEAAIRGSNMSEVPGYHFPGKTDQIFIKSSLSGLGGGGLGYHWFPVSHQLRIGMKMLY